MSDKVVNYAGWHRNIAVKSNGNPNRLKRELNTLKNNGGPLWDMLNWTANVLPFKPGFEFMLAYQESTHPTIVVNQHLRIWDPKKYNVTTDDVVRHVRESKENSDLVYGKDINHINNLFYGRPNINEQEFIYKIDILKSGSHSPQNSNHFWGRGIDIRTVGGQSIKKTVNGKEAWVPLIMYDNRQSDKIVRAILDEFSPKFDFPVEVINHAVKGGVGHIHIGYKTKNPEVIREEINKLNTACGYDKPRDIPDVGVAISSVGSPAGNFDPSLNLTECKRLVDTDLAELNMDIEGRSLQPVDIDPELEGKKLPVEIGENGLMEVLKIGDLDFLINPVMQISFSQTSQVMRFETLRTKGDPKIPTTTVPSTVSVSIVFPSASEVNDDLRRLVAQFMMTPITVVQSRFIARTMKSFEVDAQDKGDLNEFKKVSDERVWMVLNSMHIKSMPGLPESFEVQLELDYFEHRVFGGKLHFLVDERDVDAKYYKKRWIRGTNMTNPSDQAMIKNSESLSKGSIGELPMINLTSNPSSSKLYKDYYSTLIAGPSGKRYKDDNLLSTFVPDSEGKLLVLYNDADFNRVKMKEVEHTNWKLWNQSIQNAAVFITASDDVNRFIHGQFGLSTLTKSDMLQIGRTYMFGTFSMLSSVFRQSNIYKLWRTVRDSKKSYMAEAAVRANKAVKKWEQIGGNQGLSTRSIKAATEMFVGSAQLAANARVPEQLLSMPFNNKWWDLNEVRDDVTGEGLIAKVEAAVGTQLFNVQDITKEQQKELKINEPNAQEIVGDMRKALQGITSTFLDMENDERMMSDKNTELHEALSHVNRSLRNSSSAFALADGKNSIIVGVSFSIGNKVVPLPVIGWQKPTFQHLGRSDWNISMNLIVEGDEYIRQLMYIINRSHHVAKQVQLSNPVQFADLDTTLEIIESGGIFHTLGIRKMILSSVNISSIPGHINTYNITMNLEQGDLLAREDTEIFKTAFEKDRDRALTNIVPILKAIIVGGDRNFGRLLDYERIKDVVEFEGMDKVWKEFNMDHFDYMDKYHIFKFIVLLEDKDIRELNDSDYRIINDLTFNGFGDPDRANKLIAKARKIAKSGHLDILSDSSISGAVRASLKNNTDRISEVKEEAEKWFSKMNRLIDLVQDDINGDLVFPSVTSFDHPQIVESLQEYYVGLFKILSAIKQQELKDRKTNTAYRKGLDIKYYMMYPKVPTKSALDKIRGIAFDFGLTSILQNKLLDIARDFLIDDNALSLIPENVTLGNRSVRSIIKNLRENIIDSITGCYPDFDLKEDIGSVPAYLIDPAFYLFAQDHISSSLIRENIEDLNRKIDVLKAKAVNTAIISGRDYKKLKDELPDRFKKPGFTLAKGYINQSDMDWLDSIVESLDKIHTDSISELTDESANKLGSLYDESADFMGYAKEEALLKIMWIHEGLRMDTLISSLEDTTDKLVHDNKIARGTSGTSEKFNHFMKDTFQSIIDAGGIYPTWKRGKSIDQMFRTEGSKKGIYGFYGEGMRNVINNVNRFAQIQMAYNNMQKGSARALAEYNGIVSDPRVFQKRGDQIRSLVDAMHKVNITDQSGNPSKIFPTYKVYLVEEDAPEWGIFHDFYDYSAVQEITVVQDVESASDTCVIKLSNITGKLTDSFAEHVPEVGTDNLPMSSMMLKAGTVVIVKMGYSNNQVDLPIVFYGRIVEVNAGPIVEVVCQSFGAELGSVVASEGKYHGGETSINGIGNVATWILNQTQGLDHLGKLGYSDIDVNDSLRAAGTRFSGIHGKSKNAQWFTGIKGLALNDPRDDNIYLTYNTSGLRNSDILPTLSGYGLSWVGDKFKDVGRMVAQLWRNNFKFAWYIKNISAWDALEELTWFQPDTIKTILPYNDNVFPFIPRIRSTLYVGRKSGYYKYTDSYNINLGATTEDELLNIANNFLVLVENAIKLTPDQETFFDANVFKVWSRFATGNFVVDGLVDDIRENQVNDKSVLYKKRANSLESLVTMFTGSEESVRIISAILGVDANAFYYSREDTEIFSYFNHKRDQVKMRYFTVGDMIDKFYYNYVSVKGNWNNKIDKDIATEKLMKEDNLTEGAARQRIRLIGTRNALSLDGERTGYILDKEKFRNDVVDKFRMEDGILSLKANREGNHDQYRKVQQHHLLTSHTNIINNNIIATSNGWANQIRLLSFDEPVNLDNDPNALSENKDELNIELFNLDDDIHDDSIRTKELFCNNITSNTWDDANFAKYAIANKGDWVSRKGSDTVTVEGQDKKPKVISTVTDHNKVKEVKDNTSSDTAWSMLPSRWRVGISILAKEACKMYDGDITIVGNANIKPWDIAHIIDQVNDMQGAVEVRRVIHTLNSSTGFTSRIQPGLIVRQKDKFDNQETFYVNKMLEHSSITKRWGLGFSAAASVTAAGTTSTALGWGAGLINAAAGAGFLPAAATIASSVFAIPALIVGAGVMSVLGYKALKNHTQRFLSIMGRTIGRDSLDLMPLTYKGLPYYAGIDGYRKDGPMRHMYSAAFKNDGKLGLVERFAYANAPTEAEYLLKFKGDSAGMTLFKTAFGRPEFLGGQRRVGVNDAFLPAAGLVGGAAIGALPGAAIGLIGGAEINDRIF